MASVAVKRYLYIFLAFIFAAVAAMASYQVLRAKPGTKSITVFVAKGSIGPRTVIGQSGVEKEQFPMASYPDAAADPIGKAAKVGIVPGEVITNGMLLQSTGGSGLSAEVPANMYAMSIPINQVTGVNDSIEPGDHVNVLASDGSGGSYNVLSGILVLDKTSSVLTLEVSHADGLAVVQAEQHGTLTVLLRGIASD